jgi:hypothetical protein
VTIQNSSDTTRARARVYPSNYAGVLDDAKNATLYKSMLVHPCDPIPTASETAKPDEPWSPDWGPSAEGGGEAAGLGEAGEAAAAL